MAMVKLNEKLKKEEVTHALLRMSSLFGPEPQVFMFRRFCVDSAGGIDCVQMDRGRCGVALCGRASVRSLI